MRFLLVLAALWALAACGGPSRPQDASEQAQVPLDPLLLKHYTKTLRQYTDTLLLCNSPLPADWDKAVRQFDALKPFKAFDDDPRLIDEFRRGSANARQDLGRRGVILSAMAVFDEKYDKRRWDDARGMLTAAGEPGQVLLLKTLFGMLLNGQRSDVWVHVRYQIVEAGPFALETAGGLAERLAQDCPADMPIFRGDDLTQVIQVLIGFGDGGRPTLDALAKHSKSNVRRCVARAIGEAADGTAAPILIRLFSQDPEWTVRTAAAQAAERMASARDLVGPALVARITKEVDRLVLRVVFVAIGQLHYDEAVPVLVAALEHPSRELAEAAMTALYHITGEKFTRRELWDDWYSRIYPLWKLKKDEAVPELIKVLETAKPDTADSAMRALREITGEKWVRPEQWMRWHAEQYPLWKLKIGRAHV